MGRSRGGRSVTAQPERAAPGHGQAYGEEGDDVLRLWDASQGRELARLKDVGKVADWLDEYGDPDRAEFIRVQVGLAAASPADPAYPDLLRAIT